MKKLVSILTVAFLFVASIHAQDVEKKSPKRMLSVEQQTTLALKKMTLKFNLTEEQQGKVKPLIANQISDKMAMREKREANKESEKKLTVDERYEKVNAQLDKEIAFKKSMKEILDEAQFAKFEEKRKHKEEKKMEKIEKMDKKMKKKKEKKEKNPDN